MQSLHRLTYSWAPSQIVSSITTWPDSGELSTPLMKSSIVTLHGVSALRHLAESRVTLSTPSYPFYPFLADMYPPSTPSHTLFCPIVPFFSWGRRSLIVCFFITRVGPIHFDANPSWVFFFIYIRWFIPCQNIIEWNTCPYAIIHSNRWYLQLHTVYV